MIEVVSPGPLALVEDLGRPGLAAWGVPRSGAADRGALRLANRLVANPEGAACIEVTLGGLVLSLLEDHLLALAGAPAQATVDDVAVGHRAPFLAHRGSVLRLAVPETGLRTYLAVRGGLEPDPVLGSRSADVLSGLGPRPLRAGDRLAVGTPQLPGPVAEAAPARSAGPSIAGPANVRVRAGARAGWFAPDVLDHLAAATFVVAAASNRVAIRLEGPPAPRAAGRGEYPSEGLVRGAVQVPPTGRPIVFLADHPVTGGYPVVGVVPGADADRLAQVRPGDEVRFVLS